MNIPRLSWDQLPTPVFLLLDYTLWPTTLRRFTKQEIKDAYTKMQDLTNQWHSDVEGGKLSDERDCDESSLWEYRLCRFWVSTYFIVVKIFVFFIKTEESLVQPPNVYFQSTCLKWIWGLQIVIFILCKVWKSAGFTNYMQQGYVYLCCDKCDHNYIVLPSTKPATFPFLLICVKSTYWDVLNRLAVWCTINYICACWRDISGL